MPVFLLSFLACVASEGPLPSSGHLGHDHDDHDHGALPDLSLGAVCGDLDDADLAAAWCVRLAPDATLTEPHDPPEGDPPSPSPGESQTRCADLNMLQSVALVGAPDAPGVGWCDPNLGGGPRLARWQAESARFEGAVFADEGCVPASHALGLLPEDDGGWRAAWLGRDHRGSLVRAAALHPDGALRSPPETVEGTWGVVAVEPLSLVRDDALLALDGEALSVARVVDRAVDDARPLGDGVDAWGSASDGDAVWVAVCAAGRVRLDRLDPVTLAARTVDEIDVPCGIGGRVHVAAGPGGIAASWHGLDGGWLWLHDGVDPLALVHLGDAAAAPAVAAWGDGWLTVDAAGAVRLWSADGAEEGAFTHPNLVGRAARGGDVQALEVLVEGRALVLAVVGQETLRMDPHVYNYQTLELSRVELP